MSARSTQTLTWRILFLGVLLIPGTVIHARSPSVSLWMDNLSSTATLEPPDVTWSDEFSNLQVVDKTVHTLWYSRKSDWNDHRFVYRRSTDDGISWRTPSIIASASDVPGSELIADQRAQYLCVSDKTVHIVIPRGFPISNSRSWYYNLYYFRSTDNGASFEPARVLVAGADVWHIRRPWIACNSKRVVIGYNYYANWYDNYQVQLLISKDGGNQFSNRLAVGAADDNGSIEEVALNGTDIYVMHSRLIENYYYGNFQARIGVAASSDDGTHFANQWMTTKAKDGRYYALSTKDYYNSPDLAVVGSRVYVIWNQLDTDYNGARTLMFRRSLDKGKTYDPPLVMQRSDALALGQETLAAKGNHVYILFPTNDGKISLRRSLDAGQTFRKVQIVSDTGGWWPQVQTDPDDPTGASVYLLWDKTSYRRSVNGGQSFDKVLWTYPAFTTGVFERSQRLVLPGQRIHTISSAKLYSGSVCDGYCDYDIQYRRLAPARIPTTTGKGLKLFTGSVSYGERVDNMQVLAKTIDLTGPLTAEIWVKDQGGGFGTGYTDYRTPIFFKQKDLSTGYRPAYAIGTLDYYGQRKIMVDIETTTGFHSLSAPGDQGLLSPKTWTHVAVTYDPSLTTNNLKLYRNGDPIATGTITGTIDAGVGNLFIGRYGNWVVDEFRLWNRALGRAAIKGNMNKPLTGNESGLRAYFNFDQTTRDITGHGNDGLLMYREQYVSGKF